LSAFSKVKRERGVEQKVVRKSKYNSEPDLLLFLGCFVQEYAFFSGIMSIWKANKKISLA
jgi:hypothetical protein